MEVFYLWMLHYMSTHYKGLSAELYLSTWHLDAMTTLVPVVIMFLSLFIAQVNTPRCSHSMWIVFAPGWLTLKSECKPSGLKKLITVWLQCTLRAYITHTNVRFLLCRYNSDTVCILRPNGDNSTRRKGKVHDDNKQTEIESISRSKAVSPVLQDPLLIDKHSSWTTLVTLFVVGTRHKLWSYVSLSADLMSGRNVTLAWLACQRQHNTRDREAWLVSLAPGESIAAGEECRANSPSSAWTELQCNWRHGGGQPGERQGPTL